ncbi:MAG TPA: ATPase, T2SS/T4P/T4SS family [Vicinamibacteria bacterium]|nr:ATPase, T2SS/T4P/T4SS family [Vicinamibacteria bacterium]
MVVEKGYAKEIDIARALAKKLALPFVDLSSTDIEAEAVAAVDEKLARKHQVFPIKLAEKGISLAMSDPLDMYALEDVRFHTGYEVLPVISLSKAINAAINRHYNVAETLNALIGDMPPQSIAIEVINKGEPRLDEQKLRRLSEALPVVRVVNLILAEAIREKASDIHIEPGEKQLMVRTRVDGILQNRMTLPKWIQPAVTSRIKIISRLDIAEKRLPQDGRLQVRIDGQRVDLRISTLPAKHGEKVVVRVLPRTALPSLEKLGMDEETLSAFRELVNQPQGVVLVTGPTGSGKTTTLYAALGEMKVRTLNIVTLEDPIEFGIDAINQVQINEKAGLSFAVGLRSVLRQDPDVIYVGEMRDEETASVALKASLTGHLVLSTLHTSTASSAVARLVDMGIPPYLVGSAVTAVLSQRLLRVICEHCKVPTSYTDSELAGLKTILTRRNKADWRLALHPSVERIESGHFKAWVDKLMSVNRPARPLQLYEGEGCSECSGTGYSGRTGVFELLRVTSSVRELIYHKASEDKIVKAAENFGMRSLLHKACDLLIAGETSLEEVVRVMATERTNELICKRCGAELESDFVGCPYCGLSSLRSCRSCGHRIEPEWKFCAYCRQPLEVRASAPGFGQSG